MEAIYRREQIYWGHNVDQAADIVFIPTRMEYFGFGEYEFGTNEIIESVKRGISGTHRLNGMALLWGRAICAGGRLRDAQILDLAPTILHLMGHSVPHDMDGRILTEALRPEYAEVRPGDDLPSATASPPPSTAADDVLSAENAELIVERLRGLGYVG